MHSQRPLNKSTWRQPPVCNAQRRGGGKNKTHEDVDKDRSAEGVEQWPQQLDNHEAISGKRKMNACALYSMTSETKA